MHKRESYNRDFHNVVVIGAGNVGSTCAYAILQDGIADQITLIDKNYKKARGIAMDMSHGMLFAGTTRMKVTRSYSACADADIIIVTAGISQNPGETRNDLLARNVEIIEGIGKEIKKHANKNAIILMVTNPVDVLTYKLLEVTGWFKSKVIGTGTVLDTARFRYLMGRHLDIHPHDIDAYVLGEHGDTEFIVWSQAKVAGIPLAKMKAYNKKKADAIFKHTRDAAYEIIESGVSSRFAIGLAVGHIVKAIFHDANEVLPVSSYLSGYKGVKDICMSVPCVLNRDGVKSQLLVPMNANEKKKFLHSAKIIKTAIKSIH